MWALSELELNNSSTNTNGDGVRAIARTKVGSMPTETLDVLMSVRGVRHNLHVRLAVDDRNDPSRMTG